MPRCAVDHGVGHWATVGGHQIVRAQVRVAVGRFFLEDGEPSFGVGDACFGAGFALSAVVEQTLRGPPEVVPRS
ncbi:hypothetical protein CH272_18280 [Rhodococcus sp. 05-340-1]|nr:hypothetical protein CH254_14530 [Rhodococcus sp. 06-412-2C]OZC96421.1 hypothetical protein CH279_14700 [Rhodococcus sp. 06-412-2B]OZD65404.1 hypothetical protein CH271_20515 [Rhodococcus sp. 05-340-2]OZD74550.1 hypothetical protein CH272_18280 [Rhodococcus sp. 05-340-1]OZD86678.1 hypothetical protein CH273_00750 [Rhodococcus sp. 05-339-2]